MRQEQISRIRIGAVIVACTVAIAACSGSSDSAPSAAPSPAPVPAPIGPEELGPEGDWEWNSLEELIAAADADGRMVFVGSAVVVGGAQGMKVIESALNEKYGTSVSLEYVPGPSMTEAANRVIQEVTAGQASFSDVLWSPNSGGGSGLWQYTREHPIHLFDDLPEGDSWLVYDNRAIQIMTDFPGVIYNTDIISEDEVPKTLEELVDPKWKGMVSAGAEGAIWFYIPFIVGEKGYEYYERYNALNPGFIRCGQDARTASGEFPIFALSCGEYGVRQLQANNAPIAARVLNDACILLHWHLLVPETSRAPALAHLFSAFMATPEGQAAYYEAAMVSDTFFDTPARATLESAQAQGAQCLETGGRFQEENEAAITESRTRMAAIASR